MKASFYTLGCKLNQLETEALASSFRGQGFLIVDSKESADLFLLNSCTVTSKSDQKSRKWLRRVSKLNPDALVIAAGCYAQLDPEILKRTGENVFIIDQHRKDLLLDFPVYISETAGHKDFSGLSVKDKRELLKIFLQNNKDKREDRFRYELKRYNFHSRAFLKIQDGCSYRCTYCRVPFARGDSISLSADRIVKHILKLEENGYREVVLTGVNIASYYSEGCDFLCLLDKILTSRVSIRIRLSSIEPERIDKKLCSIISDSRICSHFHIPVQSGSDRILSMMKRRYNRDRIYSAVKMLKSIKADPFIAADIIAGFPGETEEDYMQSFDLLKDNSFSKLHVFPYSPRPGTEALSLKPGIPERVRDDRVRNLLGLSEELFSSYLKQWKNRETEIVIESVRDDSITGLSSNYLKVEADRTDCHKKDKRICKGGLVPVRIIKTGDVCKGELL